MKNSAAALLKARKAGKALAEAAATAGVPPDQAKNAGAGIRELRQESLREQKAAGNWEPINCDPDNGEEFYDNNYWYWVKLKNKVTGEKYDVACTAGKEVLTDGEWHAHYRQQEAWTLSATRHLTLHEWQEVKEKAENYLADCGVDLPTVESAEATGYLGCDDPCPEDITVTATLTDGRELEITDLEDLGAQEFEVGGCTRYLTEEESDIITEAYNEAIDSMIDGFQDKIDALERAKI